MVAAIRLRELSAEEQAKINKLAPSRTAPARAVERARIIQHASPGLSAPKIAQGLGAEVQAVRRWIHRFNAEGLAGLADRRRAGRPATSTAAQVAPLMAPRSRRHERSACPLRSGHWTGWPRTCTRPGASP